MRWRRGVEPVLSFVAWVAGPAAIVLGVMTSDRWPQVPGWWWYGAAAWVAAGGGLAWIWWRYGPWRRG